MLGLFLFLMLVTYCPAAVWAQRTGGLLRLWGLCALTLFAIIAFSLAASRVYSVPSSGRVVVYALTVLGPAVLCTAGCLTLLSRSSMHMPRPIVTAFVGGVLGLIAGLLMAIYALGVW